MKGLELARKYWEEVGKPAFEKECPEVLERASVGLVGEGSECFGFDDEVSRDHDWGPGFCVWLSDEDMKAFGEKAAAVYRSLPEEYMGFQRLAACDMSGGRVGVMSSGSFYARYIGFDRAPGSIFEWRCIPEKGLCVVTNGEVFQDNCEAFGRVRKELLGYFPEDLRKKKLAKAFALAAQSGQYNYSRCARRGETVAAYLACAEFMQSVQAAVFLLNKRYMPYYKWTDRAMKTLPKLGADLSAKLGILTSNAAFHVKVDVIEDISAALIERAKAEGLTSSDADFLLPHAMEIQSRIEDPELARMHVMAE